MWKATTSALAINSMEDMDEKVVEKEMEEFYCKFSEQALDVMRLFVNDLDEDGLHNFRHIIANAVALDKEICRQAARLDWIFPHPHELVPFDPDWMAVEVGEAPPQPGQHVGVAMAPALKKRGRSTGENFEVEYLLLNMEVTCLPLSSGLSWRWESR